MAEFAAVVQQLALNNAEERERDSNMNRNIAYQAEQTRDATVQGFKFLADMFDDMRLFLMRSSNMPKRNRNPNG